MSGPWHNLQILQSIIAFITVDVMNNLVRCQLASNMPLHDKPVFIPLNTIGFYSLVFVHIAPPRLPAYEAGPEPSPVTLS